jgi:hypothetical protein
VVKSTRTKAVDDPDPRRQSVDDPDGNYDDLLTTLMMTGDYLVTTQDDGINMMMTLMILAMTRTNDDA